MQFIAPEAALPAHALHLDNSADVLALREPIARYASVVLHFPKWTDGRAYSQAVLLRGRLRYRGQVVAAGEVLADMLPLLRRCGFDAARLRADQQPESARRALGFFHSHDFHLHYQTVAPERTPSFNESTPP
jgi:uncharacterized protein (DUF934 family)